MHWACFHLVHAHVIQTCLHKCKMSVLSEYYAKLSDESKRRYIEKMRSCGIRNDPYVIENEQWEESPDIIPRLTWLIQRVRIDEFFLLVNLNICKLFTPMESFLRL